MSWLSRLFSRPKATQQIVQVATKAVPKTRGGKFAASAVLLAAAAAYITPWEGTRYVPYRDIGGVWTVCQGHTGSDIIPGKRYTAAECDALLRKDILEHEARLFACAPEITTLPDESYIAINSWAFNVGTGAACKSTLIRKVKVNDFRGACEQLSRWVFVNGKVIRGLKNRRVDGLSGMISERTLCLWGLDR
jgi:lysozyme